MASEHDRLASELLAILVSAGFVEPTDAGGRFVATAHFSSADVVGQLGRLKESADELADDVVPDLASNVKLIWVCMQALPQILTGEWHLPLATLPTSPCTIRSRSSFLKMSQGLELSLRDLA